MTFTTIEACDAAEAAWIKHLAEFPSNPSYLFVVGFIKRTRANIIKEMEKNGRTT